MYLFFSSAENILSDLSVSSPKLVLKYMLSGTIGGLQEETSKKESRITLTVLFHKI